ncbi:MAG: asparaginase domain-containing protein [Candidatus Paceibacterota bacterium]|jgi:L-asparaginase
MTKTHIHIIKMGGTIEFIDPAYDNINKSLMKMDSTIDSYLKNIIKPHFTYNIENVCEKDSREIKPEDLEKLIKIIETSPHDNILITHGTFTMKDTAKFLEEHFSKGEIKKKMILTGSMIPIVGFSVSDAPFNLGYSISSFNNIESGVYLCVNGGIFKYGEVEKNIELLRFE